MKVAQGLRSIAKLPENSGVGRIFYQVVSGCLRKNIYHIVVAKNVLNKSLDC